jgi:hypothetical protein
MERIPSTSTVGPHDGRASAQVEHQYVRARVAQEPVCVVGPLPVRDFFSTAIPFSFLSPREKFLGYYYPFFFPHLTCKQCTMTPSFSYICPGMTLHVVLQCRTHLRPSPYRRVPTDLRFSSLFRPLFLFRLAWSV